MLDPAPDPESGTGSTSEQRPRHRTAAAMLAAGMFGLDEALGRKPREEAPIVVDASGNPVDIDSEGIELVVENGEGAEVSVVAPAQPRSLPLISARAASGSRRRGGRAG